MSEWLQVNCANALLALTVSVLLCVLDCGVKLDDKRTPQIKPRIIVANVAHVIFMKSVLVSGERDERTC